MMSPCLSIAMRRLLTRGLLGVLTIAVLCLPAGCRRPPDSRPAMSDLIGTWQGRLSRGLKRDQGLNAIQPSLTLRPDGTFTVKDLLSEPPMSDRAYVALRRSQGTWQLVNNDGWGLALTFPTPGHQQALGDGTIEIVNRSAPYELVLILGDPDTRREVWYRRIHGEGEAENPQKPQSAPQP